MDTQGPALPDGIIIERRELRFGPAALKRVVGWLLGAAAAHGLPPAAPEGIELLPQDNRVDLVYGQGSAARSFSLQVEALGMLLIAYCIRARIPMPRVAHKEVRVGERYVSLVFHLEHSQSPAPEAIEAPVARHAQARQWR